MGSTRRHWMGSVATAIVVLAAHTLSAGQSWGSWNGERDQAQPRERRRRGDRQRRDGGPRSDDLGAIRRQVGLIKNTSEAWPGYTLFAPKHFLYTYLMTNDGQVVNTWTSRYEPGESVYLLPNGNLLHCCFTKNGGFTRGGEGGRIEEYDWDGKLVWEFDYASDTYLAHHDIAILPNGNILALAVEKKSYQECLAAGFRRESLRDRELYPDYVVEIQPTRPTGGRIVWEWHVWDHLIQEHDRAKASHGDVSEHPERIWVDCNGRAATAFWNHMNSIDYNPDLDQIMLSVRGSSELWIIDHSTTTGEAKGSSGGRYGRGGGLLYRWGNPAAYQRGSARDQVLFQQHDTQWIPEGCPGAGNILVFNNGLRRLPPGVTSARDLPGPVGKGWGYSSLDELVPPIDADGTYRLEEEGAYGPSELTWTYVVPEPATFFAEAISGCQRLPNGNTLICDGTSGVFLEVTPDKRTVWEYVCPVTGDGPIKQGDPIPRDHRAHLMNAVFKIMRYPAGFSGFAGTDLTPRGELVGMEHADVPENLSKGRNPRGVGP